jgi:hypothetical protein
MYKIDVLIYVYMIQGIFNYANTVLINMVTMNCSWSPEFIHQIHLKFHTLWPTSIHYSPKPL